ncbi:short-chain dehydrogenase/ reductase-like protein [Tothia fuscella]|uniref:Short-chain dehydrogenase/ reductase-like protein n=1 Tax=Tothia fuscella TaxID=1048955 RepID=A0A9P4P1P5_9PEZI|nr:short-chain dehydrogenase/ reductase-like protein [Tothia fuscella]
MGFTYKKVLVVGATSGIGWALSERLISNGVKVIVVGRRKEKLDEFVKKHGNEKASSFVFDISKLDGIPRFAADVAKAHPDLDSVLLNSGIQRSFNFADPSSVDLNVINEEFTTNYLSFVHLTNAFLPHLQKQQNETSIIFTTSGLALVPMSRCLNYCASKAALHHFVLCLRDQMRRGPGNVKIIELIPPAVQTELHDAKHQPELKDAGPIGMPLDEYIDETWKGMDNGDVQIVVGEVVKKAADSWEKERQENFSQLAKMMAGQEKD